MLTGVRSEGDSLSIRFLLQIIKSVKIGSISSEICIVIVSYLGNQWRGRALEVRIDLFQNSGSFCMFFLALLILVKSWVFFSVD